MGKLKKQNIKGYIVGVTCVGLCRRQNKMRMKVRVEGGEEGGNGNEG